MSGVRFDRLLAIADIWPALACERARPETAQMQANVGAEQVYFWGQEVVAVAEEAEAGGRPPFTLDGWRAFVQRAGIPLMGEHVPGYAALCTRALYTQVVTRELVEGARCR